MTNVLDTYPLDFSHPEVQQLKSTLLSTFDSPAVVRDLMRSAGVDAGYVDMSGPMNLVWTAVLDAARKQDRLRVLLSSAAKDPNAAAIRPMLYSLLAQTLAASTDPTDSIDDIANRNRMRICRLLRLNLLSVLLFHPFAGFPGRKLERSR